MAPAMMVPGTPLSVQLASEDPEGASGSQWGSQAGLPSGPGQVFYSAEVHCQWLDHGPAGPLAQGSCNFKKPAASLASSDARFRLGS
jgi:hypothetical protein